MISLEAAQQHILALVAPLTAERVFLDDALGRVLADDALATRAQPPADNSAMDGYAVRWADVAALRSELGCGDDDASDGPGIRLAVAQTIPAGGWSDDPVLPGEAARIMTGAPLPPGDDLLVVMREWTDESEDSVVIRQVGAGPGDHVRRAGEDIAEGAVYLEAGATLQAPDLALLASQGVTQVDVRRSPVVGIVSTGDEVHDPGEPLPPGHIWNSNVSGLKALVREAGGTPRYLGIARDTHASLREVFGRIGGCDALVSIGGVSVGDFDHVKEVLAELGGEQTFWKVAMRPGKPNACGTVAGVPYFGLPGNPVSAMVSFLQYVRPALRRMQGSPALFLPTVDAVTTDDLRTRRGFLFLLRGLFERADGGWSVRTTGAQGSGIMASLSAADCLIAVPEDVDVVPAGSTVRVQLLPWSHRGQPEPGLRRA